MLDFFYYVFPSNVWLAAVSVLVRSPMYKNLKYELFNLIKVKVKSKYIIYGFVL